MGGNYVGGWEITRARAGVLRRWRWLAVVAAALAAVVLLFGLSPSRVRARRPAASSATAGDYSSVGPIAEILRVCPEQVEVHTVAVAEGSLWRWSCLRLEMRRVDGGVVSGCYAARVGMSAACIDSGVRYKMRTPVAVCKARTARGQVVFLAAEGRTVTGGGCPMGVLFSPGFRETYERDIAWYRSEIVYVEGDNAPVVRPSMSVGEFARRNSAGHFLVVEASIP